MVAAQHKLSRRALLAGACAGAAFPRHSGLDPESTFLAAAVEKERWIPDHGTPSKYYFDGNPVRDDGKWRRALARYAQAEAGLEAVAHSEDDDLYGRALGRQHAALARLLRTPAPDLAAVARKLDLIVRHSAFELSLAESCLVRLRQDIGRLAVAPPPCSAWSPSPRNLGEEFRAA